ncbi:MAG: Eco57I restriction-modification methylase domain-containing protein [Chitinophagaceae bacterium]|nr:Eco57I restriction-modification methylase domain-containing protein [Chitinophagaceae bacterium]
MGLELCITWVNRILFLKLLEAQLLKYHKGNNQYRFLNFENLPQYDEVYKLFFQVLARRYEERIEKVQKKFSHIPYLNSSLFESSEMEEATIKINMLDGTAELDLISSTVLRNDKNKAKAARLNTLQYFFEFLDAYDFASEGSEEIQEESKTLINASVLGLIFEKINGYKDGSIFTPGFITMYMCRQSIRQAVVNKFKEKYNWKAETFGDLHNYISEDRSAKKLKEYNEQVNSLTICDPAVGSGHFLVSALNELIAVKDELGILISEQGTRLSEIEITLENDELIITDAQGDIFQYIIEPDKNNQHYIQPWKQAVQKTLFHEKQTIIENCLFGVDINPKSVQICRLRLWIELLKNAYYIIPEGQPQNSGRIGNKLQTLPNIDINIKCGNSLISRFSTTENLKAATPYFEKKILEYKSWVADYKHEVDKDKKRGIQQLMKDLKTGFLSKITDRNPTKIKLDKLSSEFLSKYVNEKLFSDNLTVAQKKDKDRLDKEIKKLNEELEAYIKNPVFTNTFEWRFEFPEVLNENGDFVGFDIVIGNPPYIRQEELGSLKEILSKTYSVYAGTADILVYFFELGIKILKPNGTLSLISSNKFIRANYGAKLREFLWGYNISKIIDFGELQVFEEAATFPVIVSINKSNNKKQVEFTQISTLKFLILENFIRENGKLLGEGSFNGQSWSLGDATNTLILNKLKTNSYRLTDYVDGEIYRGVLTGFNEAFIIDDEKRKELIEKDKNSKQIIYKIIVGDDIRKYELRNKNRYIILTKVGININNYPAIFEHLKQYQTQLEKRWDKGNHWWELRPCKYYDKFSLPKIHIPAFALESRFAIDKGEYVSLNPAYFIPKDDKYLLALLNSKVIWYFLRKITPVLGDESKRGRLVIRTVYFENIPIKKAKSDEEKLILKLVDDINSLRENNSDTGKLETQIDKMVYKIYDLTPDEIKIIEDAV